MVMRVGSGFRAAIGLGGLPATAWLSVFGVSACPRADTDAGRPHRPGRHPPDQHRRRRRAGAREQPGPPGGPDRSADRGPDRRARPAPATRRCSRANIDWNDQTQPPASFLLAGNASQIVGNNSATTSASARSTSGAATTTSAFNNARATTNNIFTNFNPQLTRRTSTLSYTQPLLRNFKIDGTRQQLLVSAEQPRRSPTCSCSRSIALTARNVKNAYYDMMLRGRQPQRAAPVAGAGAAVAQGQPRPRRDRHHGADRHRPGRGRSGAARGGRHPRRGRISRAEDRLRALVFNPTRAGLLARCTSNRPSRCCSARRRSTPTPPSPTPCRSGPTCTTSRKQLETNDVNIRYFKNQTMPDVNASLTYFAQAIGGTAFVRDDPASRARSSARREKSYRSTLGTMFAGDFPTWTLQLQVELSDWPLELPRPSLARARLQDQQSRRQLQSQELQVATQIREYARAGADQRQARGRHARVAHAGRTPPRSRREEVPGRHDRRASWCSRRSAT